MKVCVFGASSRNISPVYTEQGRRLGLAMAKRNMTLIFGGGQTGMMGAVETGVLEGGGFSIGVAPKFFDTPGILSNVSAQMIYTDTMAERKALMADAADAFVAVPGSIGTLEEFFEMLTLKQVGQLDKPIAILNVNGFYDQMESMLLDFVKQDFMEERCLDLYFMSDDIRKILDYLEEHK